MTICCCIAHNDRLMLEMMKRKSISVANNFVSSDGLRDRKFCRHQIYTQYQHRRTAAQTIIRKRRKIIFHMHDTHTHRVKVLFRFNYFMRFFFLFRCHAKSIGSCIHCDAMEYFNFMFLVCFDSICLALRLRQ